MIVKLGRYEFQSNEASVEIARRGLVGDSGIVYAWEHTWTISGRLIRDTVAELSNAIEGLENACRNIRGECRILFDDGTPTKHHILPPTLDGIKCIVPPSYPTSEGAEYVTYRTFTLTIQAEKGFTGVSGPADPQAGADLVRWEETLSLGGGDPIDITLVALNTTPVTQRVSPQRPYTAHQRGVAIRNSTYPTPPGLLFSGVPIVENTVSRTTPTENRTGFQNSISNWGVQWSYRFVSATPLIGQPTRRPA